MKSSTTRITAILAAVLLFSLLPSVLDTEIASAAEVGLTDPGALTVHEGDLWVREDGAVIENLEIRGALRIEANNVTVRNVWVYTTGFWTIYVKGSADFEHVEIGHESFPGMRGIGGANVTGRYLDIHHVEDGIKIDSNTLYENVHVHDLASPSSDPHADAFQVDGGASNAIIRNSILDSTGSDVGLGNAAAQIESDLGPIDNILVENSYLNGGAYTIFVRDGGNGFPTNVVFRNNTFGSQNAYGLLSAYGPITFENNTTTDGRLIDGNGNPLAGYFSDDDGNVHEGAINQLAQAGIVKGCAPDQYCPESPVTRGQMAVLILRTLGESPSSGSRFSDVPSDAYYAGAVNRLAEMGIVAGCETDRFCPELPVSRAEMSALLVRALNSQTGPSVSLFIDVPSTAWYAPTAEALYELGITTGCGTDPLRYCPANQVTRAEAASFLVRSFNP